MYNFDDAQSFTSSVTKTKSSFRISFSILLDQVDQIFPEVQKLLSRYSIRKLGNNKYEQRYQVEVGSRREAEKIIQHVKQLDVNGCYII